MYKREVVDGLVLKNVNYKEADKIYTLFSPQLGKFSISAKGIRKISSRRMASLDTLTHVNLVYSMSPNGYRTLQEVKIIHTYPKVKSSIKTLSKALYITEVVHRFIDEDLHHELKEVGLIFDLLSGSLRELEVLSEQAKEQETEHIVTKFEYRFMQILGYEPNLKGQLGLYDSLVAEDIRYLTVLRDSPTDSNATNLYTNNSSVFLKSHLQQLLDRDIVSSVLL